ncbi:MAG: hypothetical protein U0836_03640 [Pirellulales bacterium]
MARTFTLRTILLTTTLVAVACGFLGLPVQRARRQWRAVAAVHAGGGYALYDYQRVAPGDWHVAKRRHDSFADRYWSPPQVVEVRYSLEHGRATRPNVACLADLPRLAVLHIEGGLSEQEACLLPRLRALEELLIRGERLSPRAMDGIGAMRSLKRLTLDETWIDDACVAKLAGLPYLEELDLAYSQTTGLPLGRLACRARLRGLNLSDAVVTDAGLASVAELPSLERLDLTHNVQITDRGLAHLEKLASLRELRVAHCPHVTAEGLARLRRSVPGLEIDGR